MEKVKQENEHIQKNLDTSFKLCFTFGIITKKMRLFSFFYTHTHTHTRPQVKVTGSLKILVSGIWTEEITFFSFCYSSNQWEVWVYDALTTEAIGCKA